MPRALLRTESQQFGFVTGLWQLGRRVLRCEQEQDGRAWPGLAWPGLAWVRLAQNRGNGGLLWAREWTFVFYKMHWICWLAEELLASQDRMCCMEWGLVSCYEPVLFVCAPKFWTQRFEFLRLRASRRRLSTWCPVWGMTEQTAT